MADLRIFNKMSLKTSTSSGIEYNWKNVENFSNTGTDVDDFIVTVATTGTNISPVNASSTPMNVFMKNTDSTNFVDIGYDDGGTLRDLIRLLPGEYCNFKLEPSRTLRAQADTASVDLQYMLIEN